jgi:type IV pilus assembly protein PilX
MTTPAFPFQRGSVLIVGLVILLVLTLIGVSAVGGAGLQQRMATALQDRTTAFNTAEIALKQGEADPRYYASFADYLARGLSCGVGDAPGRWSADA